MWRSGNGLNALLLAAVVLSALSVVTSQHKARKLFIELQQEKEYAQQMEVEWGQLQLEQSTWATLARIEKIAVQQLQMQLPRNGQVKFIRIEPPSPQSSDGTTGETTGHLTDETTSHSTRLPKDSNQVAGYPASGRGGNRPLSLLEKGEKSVNGAADKQP